MYEWMEYSSRKYSHFMAPFRWQNYGLKKNKKNYPLPPAQSRSFKCSTCFKSFQHKRNTQKHFKVVHMAGKIGLVISVQNALALNLIWQDIWNVTLEKALSMNFVNKILVTISLWRSTFYQDIVSRNQNAIYARKGFLTKRWWKFTLKDTIQANSINVMYVTNNSNKISL